MLTLRFRRVCLRRLLCYLLHVRQLRTIPAAAESLHGATAEVMSCTSRLFRVRERRRSRTYASLLALQRDRKHLQRGNRGKQLHANRPVRACCGEHWTEGGS
jgi:hypothetical protein